MSVRKREWTTELGENRFAWVVDYVDATGRRRLKSFRRKKEANAFAATASVEVREGVHVADRETVTVQNAGAFWIKSAETAGLERSTIDQYKCHLKIHIVPLIGKLLLSKVTVPTVRAFEDRLRQNGRSAALTKKILTSLGSIFADASERGLATRNPVRDIRSRRKGRDRRSEERRKGCLEVGVDIPTREEIKRFIAALNDNWRPILLTTTLTGMRSSESRALRWIDVDLVRGEIHIRQRVDRYREIGKPKSKAGFRTIPIPPVVVKVLKELKLKQGGTSELVFPSPTGATRAHGAVVRRGLQAAMIEAGVTVETDKKDRRGSQYWPRNTPGFMLFAIFASWLINRKEDGGLGLPPKMVQERMGHSSIVVTMDTYGHLFPRLDDGKELGTLRATS